MTDEVLLHLVTSYTREAGVRSLEREIAAVCRAKAVEYAQARDRAEEGGDGRNGDVEKWGYRKEVTKEDLDVILGGVRYEVEDMEKEGLVGVSTGLAYQGSGNGGILRESCLLVLRSAD
jgi:ATP-dependent Lon protease